MKPWDSTSCKRLGSLPAVIKVEIMHHLLRTCRLAASSGIAICALTATGLCAVGSRKVAERADKLLAKEVLQDKTVAPAADDQTYLRRLSMDLTGDVPAPEEIRAFVSDRSPDKRRQAVTQVRHSSVPPWLSGCT